MAGGGEIVKKRRETGREGKTKRKRERERERERERWLELIGMKKPGEKAKEKIEKCGLQLIQ